MIDKIKKWWTGEEYYIEGALPGIRYKHHWTAKITRPLVDFYLNHWKWIFTTTLGICGLLIAYLKLA